MKEWNGHVTEEWLNAWTAGQLSKEEQQQMYTHLGKCDYCAEKFAAYLEQDLAEPPAYLTDEIFARSQCLDVQTAKRVYHTSGQVRLLLYSLKVGLAVMTSLFLLFSVSEVEEIGMPFAQKLSEKPQISITEKLEETRSSLDDLFMQFTEWLDITEYEENWND